MSWQDLVNGGFELGGGLLVWLNVRRLLRDRAVMGVSLAVMGFFELWGLWNLYYYPVLGQWASFAGGCVISAANATWLWLALRYAGVWPFPRRPPSRYLEGSTIDEERR